jgi:single-strand DNA-binding protein
MANFNKVLLMGNLTRDPELRYTPNGTAVVEFGLAINRKWTGQGGEKRDETCFVDCQAWARGAEIISEYCRKGSALFVEGRLRLESWEGRDGQKRSKLRVVVENFQFVGAPSGARGTAEGAPPRGGRPTPPPQSPQAAPEAPEEEPFKVDEDIPF